MYCTYLVIVANVYNNLDDLCLNCDTNAHVVKDCMKSWVGDLMTLHRKLYWDIED